MSWTIDEESRCAIHVGGVCVTFDDEGAAVEVLAPKSIPITALFELLKDARPHARGALGLPPDRQDRAIIVSTSLRTVPLREAAAALVAVLRSRWVRWALGSRRLALVRELERLVALSREHGIEFR
jgi:hypothetical protein